ncbi:MAG: helix-turn-helix domain-containing protein [Chloroflexi bacterium]|nr:helix-turn-helix domain-containing protein [Chloroflexota bacterium]
MTGDGAGNRFGAAGARTDLAGAGTGVAAGAGAADARASADPPSPAGVESIGEGIRRERLRRGLTLAQLATQVNLTVSALSQIERGASDPSISSLRRIAQAFDVPMFQFMVGTAQREIVVRRNRRVKLNLPDRDLEYELVSADTSGEFEVLSLTIAPGASTSATPSSHTSEECALVLRGQIVAEVAGQRYELADGDSVKIHRELLHRFTNESDTDTDMIIIISPPTF